jgi:hypothetical protein
MSILDIQVWVRKVETETKSVKNQIYYDFFEKPMSSKFVIMKNSAAPLSQKRTVLTQEGIRRLNNCKTELEWDQKTKHLDGFMQKLRNSGYDEEFRLEVLKSTLNGYEKIVEDADKEVKPMYRSKELKERNNWKGKKLFKKQNWWKGKDRVKNKSVIFVPATPGGELARMFREVEKEQRKENKNQMNFQIIEQTGLSLEKQFQRSNPFKEQSCKKSDCIVCDETGVKCRTEGVGYRGICKECKNLGLASEYIGETGKNAYTRGKQHLAGLKKKHPENAFYKHWHNAHETPCESESRQVDEMVRIINFRGTLLNSKSEWNAPL